MDEIVIAPYDSRWPDQFVTEADYLRTLLADRITRIEHFGSTAVPGLAAKPILDLLIGVRSVEEARRDIVPLLEPLGYAFWYDNPNPARLFFVKGLPPNGPRTHHLHFIAEDSPEWERLLFRDYLREQSDERERYAALKQDLAQRYREDREAYTDAKTEYIRTITKKAWESLPTNHTP